MGDRSRWHGRLSGRRSRREERVVICKCLAAKSAEFLANKERAALWSACLKILRSAGAEVFGEKI